MILTDIAEPIKTWLDTLSIGTIVATFFKIVPEVSAFLAMLYLGVRLWETDTVQKLFKKKKE